MAVRLLSDPIENPCWTALLERHPHASMFHSPGWLEALRHTYGYEPFVVTTSTGPALDNGLVACLIKGWTSNRVVSLPFSDHCDPLVDDRADLSEMLAFLIDHARKTGAAYVEMRPTPATEQAVTTAAAATLSPGEVYCFHRLDLRADETELFRRLHHSSTQRAVRRAEREELRYECGTSQSLLASFYRLLRMTRRRHGLPPPPRAWFQNLVACLGDRVSIHVASKDGRPIASLFTVAFKKTIVYKYGGSDAAQHRLGGMPFLFWRLIRDARANGFEQLDLGRSDLDQPGLIAFKDHLGATRSALTYYGFPNRQRERAGNRWMVRVARKVFSRMPDAALDLAGKSIYRHLG